MKFLATALTVALAFSNTVTAAPSAADVQRTSPSSSIQSVVSVDDSFLDITRGGLNRVACFGITFGIALGGLAAGAVTGGVGWALAGAYAPIVGTALCSL